MASLISLPPQRANGKGGPMKDIGPPLTFIGRIGQSSQNTRNRLRLYQLARLVQVVVHDRVRVDADAVVDCGQQLLWVDRVLQRSGRGLVGLAVHQAALDAGAGDAGGVAVRRVVASVGGVAVAR